MVCTSGLSRTRQGRDRFDRRLLQRESFREAHMAEPKQLPSPNAFDFYLEAARLLDDSLDTRPPRDPLPECDFTPLFCPSTPYTPREKKQLLIQNSPALA